MILIDKNVFDYSFILSILTLVLSIISLKISLITLKKDNKLRLTVQIEPSYHNKDSKKKLLIQSYNKSKIGGAFRFKGLFFSRSYFPFFSKYQLECVLNRKMNKQELLNDEVLLQKKFNKQEFEIIEPFKLGYPREITYTDFVPIAVSSIWKYEKVRNAILNKKNINIIAAYEEALGKITYYPVNIITNSELYNLIFKELVIKSVIRSIFTLSIDKTTNTSNDKNIMKKKSKKKIKSFFTICGYNNFSYRLSHDYGSLIKNFKDEINVEEVIVMPNKDDYDRYKYEAKITYRSNDKLKKEAKIKGNILFKKEKIQSLVMTKDTDLLSE